MTDRGSKTRQHCSSKLSNPSSSSVRSIAMASTLRLSGKVAIITGAASGIGEATARLFAAHGAKVVVADVQEKLGAAVADSIGGSYKCCDVTDEKQVQRTVDGVISDHGRLDVMYSNAGVLLHNAALKELSMATLEKVMAVNVGGNAACIKHAARAMVSGGVRGSILCTASVVSLQGGTAPACYTASKHAVVGLVRAAAAELGAHGIRVNCVSPYGVATPLACGFANMTASTMESLSNSMSVLKGVTLKARHVAEAALFLSSDEAAFISGQNLVLDGGITAVNTAAVVGADLMSQMSPSKDAVHARN